MLSPDGKRLAFAREVAGALETWVRDLKTKKEWKLPHVTLPVGWTTTGTLLLRLGFGVEPAKGARVKDVAALPNEVLPWALAWTSEGTRLAYVPSTEGIATTAVHVIAADGTSARLTSTDGIRTDQTVRLAWSPNGTKLHVNALFRPGKAHPWRRIGVVDVAADTLKVVAEMPDWSDLPGLHGNRRIYRDPRAGGGTLKDTFKYERPGGPRYGPNVWSGTGTHFTWLAGNGWTEADAFVADAAGAETWRLTNDGEAKWSPALDAAGQRLAFLTAEDGGNGGLYKNPMVRVVELRTETLTDLPVPHEAGVAGSLAWTPDGTGVVYEITGGSYEGTYQQAVPPAKPSPEGAAIRRVDILPTDRVRAWLASYDAHRVHAAVHRAEDGWDPIYVGPLRETLTTWAFREQDRGLVGCLISLLVRHDAREAIPELRAALGSKRGDVVADAAHALGKFQEPNVLPDLKRALAAAKDDPERLALGLAVAGLGDDAGWDALAALLKDEDAGTRVQVCLGLGQLRKPRSVDLLLPVVADTAAPRFDFHDVKTVGGAAIRALERLTGQSFGADAAPWKAWWEGEAKRTLPAKKPPTGAEPDEHE
jgi:hypothetical protein